jgi:hypothetical protein
MLSAERLLSAASSEEASMKNKSKKAHTEKSKISVDALMAKAAAVEKLAEAAKRQVRLVRAEHKAARKAYKQAKKAARRARKEAKIALKAKALKGDKHPKAKSHRTRIAPRRAPNRRAGALPIIAKKPAPEMLPQSTFRAPEARAGG